MNLSRLFKLKIKVVLTNGSEPIGNGVGPVLEIIDVIKILKRDNPPKDLEEKSLGTKEEIYDFYGKLANTYLGELNSQIVNNKYDQTNYENLAYCFTVLIITLILVTVIFNGKD